MEAEDSLGGALSKHDNDGLLSTSPLLPSLLLSIEANRERHSNETVVRMRQFRQSANAMEQAVPDDPASFSALLDPAAVRHRENVALVHNYLGETKIPSDVRIAVQAL